MSLLKKPKLPAQLEWRWLEWVKMATAEHATATVAQSSGCRNVVMATGGLLTSQTRHCQASGKTTKETARGWYDVGISFWRFPEHRCSCHKPNHVLVRARNTDHQSEYSPTLSITHTPILTILTEQILRERVSDMIAYYIMNMSYDNFKKSVLEPRYEHACHDTWDIMFRYGIPHRDEGVYA